MFLQVNDLAALGAPDSDWDVWIYSKGGSIPIVAALAQLVLSVSHHDLRQDIESLQSGVHLPI